MQQGLAMLLNRLLPYGAPGKQSALGKPVASHNASSA